MSVRHTPAARGATPRVVTEILGHSQIGLTMNVYTHVAQDTQREAPREHGLAAQASSLMSG
ncbi:hypothetical protein GCM10010505_71610 [Kitasatospora aburaviensis]